MRSDITKADNGTVATRGSTTEDEVGKSAEHQERRVRVLARVRGLEGRGGNSGADAGQLAYVSAGELDTGRVGTVEGDFGDEVRVEFNSTAGTGICKTKPEKECGSANGKSKS